jgi:fatty-acyl-CoA synthase
VQGDRSLTIEALREFLDGRLARFKHPRSLSFVDEMPTSGPSKIDREAVKAEFGAGE